MSNADHFNAQCDAAGTSFCIGDEVRRYPLSEGNAILCIRHFNTEALSAIGQGVKPAKWNDAEVVNSAD